ncbi:unnamed protein product [Kuraishia capsulata CBS 1993]|uniref:Crossover junction endonuclease MUS81 n=1 Tax=Kuraishia capsulata CBS 1993 TaxID=1382522 RepID=W6MN51_9ASCO|nr:uncharacterized protein KUCA_T00003657001 [Kuraishia capsulata CBS 1993]CDK27678.1 unnamed protein product [Kuraishia capsulata CBS 1993]
MDLPSDLKHLFLAWLEEERVKAEKFSTHLASVYSRGVDNIRASQTVFQHPKQLGSVQGVGPKTVALISARLSKYCDENGYKTVEESVKASEDKARDAAGNEEEAENPTNSKKRKPRKSDGNAMKKKTKKQYVPAKRSGGYAILITLHSFDRRRSGMTKSEIISEAAQFCESSFDPNPATGQFYSAWQSMKTLLNKELVVSNGRPARFSLTEEGSQIAETLCLEDTPKRLLKDVAPPFPILQELEVPDRPFTVWNSGDFSVVLLLDNREIKSKDNRGFFGNTLQRMGVTNETRALSIGDAVWIAKHNETGKEAILDFILERKRLDDLLMSIRDGRFLEQKSRLSRTGIDHVYYLIEEQSSRDVSFMGDSLQTAISATITNSKFHVKRTADAEETAHFLRDLTGLIVEYYKDKSLAVMQLQNLNSQSEYARRLEFHRSRLAEDTKCAHSFETLQVILSKSDMATVGEMFIRMLMAIKGVSLDKAVVIQRRYGTPLKLVDEYERYTGDGRKMLLDEFKGEVGNKKIGPVLSDKIWQVWGGV